MPTSGGPSGTGPHWLVVVRASREREELVAGLRRSFAQMRLVEVMLDRRRGERRRGGAGVASDRRRTQRRQSETRRAWNLVEPPSGYRLVERGDGYEVFEAEALVPAECPECKTPLEFQMPRFGTLPARLDLEVLHGPAGGSRVPHVVEARAYRASGRPFLACRMVARRRTPDSLSAPSLS